MLTMNTNKEKCDPTIGCQKCKDRTFVQKIYQFLKYLDLGMRLVKKTLSHHKISCK